MKMGAGMTAINIILHPDAKHRGILLINYFIRFARGTNPTKGNLSSPCFHTGNLGYILVKIMETKASPTLRQ
ncbi:MAG: hypothetical protein A2042_10115 [Candidatus Schekmanbacteria bacterium GWA2_38_11]|uniref:Uncharacterized protein n=1 Tax=Candidatus Schekmanbacteria bacterium GWA2_38_11 TaxID=1817876 RepID=A0A1F7RBM3_9BACT|nr:MAG: hypothetical protein A2042_10115 [Candidatus Schekmanbacteria bacterium GWA2_38_11]